MRGTALEDVHPRVVEIVDGRARTRGRSPARLDGAVRRRAASSCGSRRSGFARHASAPDSLGAVRATRRRRCSVLEAAAPARRRDRGGRGGSLRAPLAPALVGRHLRAGRPRCVSVLARDGGRSRPGRGRRADRRRHAAAGRTDARDRSRSRDRRGLRRRRRPGRRGAGVRNGDDRAGRQDRRAGQQLGHSGEAAGVEPRRDRPSCRAERGRPDRRPNRDPGSLRRRPAGPG